MKRKKEWGKRSGVKRKSKKGRKARENGGKGG
jgi:hypothetical protein